MGTKLQVIANIVKMDISCHRVYACQQEYQKSIVTSHLLYPQKEYVMWKDARQYSILDALNAKMDIVFCLMGPAYMME